MGFELFELRDERAVELGVESLQYTSKPSYSAMDSRREVTAGSIPN